MKRICGVGVLALLIVHCTYSLNDYGRYKDVQPVIVSERVGETVNPMERTQFNLCQGITDFESAAYFAIREGGYEVQIFAGGKRYVAVNRDRHAIEILRERIDRFEEIQASPEAFENKWRIVDYDTLGQPITYDEIKRVRRSICSCGGGYGLCLITLIPNIWLSFLIIGGLEWKWDLFGESAGVESRLRRPIPALISFVVINAASIVAGSMIGERVDDNAAINAISMARLPKELY